MEDKYSDKELGKFGENMAVKHLEKEGYQILETNYRFGKKEIDIVAQKNEEVVFVEVKTRNNAFLGQPYESVTKAKQQTIVKVANAYLEEQNLQLDARFDIISIVANSKYQNLEHLQDAFYPI